MTKVKLYITCIAISVLLYSVVVPAEAGRGIKKHFGKRYALVIGNNTYRVGPLKYPVTDAREIGDALEKVGFHVTIKENQTRKEMETSIKTFSKRLKKDGAIGVFYYAGHGLQIEGQNYIQPVDSDFETPTDVKYSAVNTGFVLNLLQEAGTLNISIFDCCRSNPFTSSTLSPTKGLAGEAAPTDSLIVFSTSPGKVAWDNRVFAKSLVRNITRKNLEVELLFKVVRVDVANATGNKQIPYVSSTLLESFCFSGETYDSIVPLPAPTPYPVVKGRTLSRGEAKQQIRSLNLFEKDYNKRGDFKNLLKTGTSRKIVRDNASNLIWQRLAPEKNFTHHGASNHIDSLNRANYGGYSDWRLPSLEELLTILDPEPEKRGYHWDSVFGLTSPHHGKKEVVSQFWASDLLPNKKKAWAVMFDKQACIWELTRDKKTASVRAVRNIRP